MRRGWGFGVLDSVVDMPNTQQIHKGIWYTMRIVDIEGERTVEIVGGGDLRPTSIFITRGAGECYEFDRMTFVQALMDEFGLVYDWDQFALATA